MNLLNDKFLTNNLNQNYLDAILMYCLMYELLSIVNFFLGFSSLVRLFIIRNDGCLFVFVVACQLESSRFTIDLLKENHINADSIFTNPTLYTLTFSSSYEVVKIQFFFIFFDANSFLNYFATA